MSPWPSVQELENPRRLKFDRSAIKIMVTLLAVAAFLYWLSTDEGLAIFMPWFK